MEVQPGNYLKVDGIWVIVVNIQRADGHFVITTQVLPDHIQIIMNGPINN